MKTFLLYTVARLAIFVACFGVLWLLFGRQATTWLIALLALLFTSGLSLLLLRKQGAAAGQALVGGVQSARERFEAAKRKEDDDT